MRRIVYLDAARDDLIDTFRYIAYQSGSIAIADAFVAQLREKVRRLADLPGTLGTPRPELRPDLRSTPCHGYAIFFRYRPDTLEVVSVFHASRDVIVYFDGE